MKQTTIPGIEKPTRPEINSDMVREAVEAVVQRLSGEASLEEVLREYSYPMDGFELAKELIRNHVDIDRDDVDELDCIDDEVRSLHLAEVKEWVVDHDIQPPHPVGTKVKINSNLYSGFYYVAGVRELEAKYELKEEGQIDEECGFRRTIVEYEDVVGVAE